MKNENINQKYKVKNPYEDIKNKLHPNVSKIIDGQVKDFNNFSEEDREKILKSAKITITEEEFKHVKRFLTLIAVTGGQRSSDGKTNQKDVYQKQGILNSDIKIKGSEIREQLDEVYGQITDENILNFYKRLLEKRALSFYGPTDFCIGRDGDKSKGCRGNKDMENYLVYPEMEISALMNIEGLTRFINEANRGHNGEPGDKGSYEKKFMDVIAAVGTRLEDKNTPDQFHFNLKYRKSIEEEFKKTLGKGRTGNLAGTGNLGRILNVTEQFVELYKEIWKEFLGIKGIEEEELTQEHLDKALEARYHNTYVKIISDAINNNSMQKAYITISGLGDGVWAGSEEQREKIRAIIGRVIAKILKSLTPEQAEKISAIEFSQWEHEEYFQAFKKEIGDGEFKEKIYKGIDIISDPKAPCAKKLKGKYENCQKTVLIAYDPNAMIGNEFYDNNLNSTSDPVVTRASYIIFSHGHHNEYLLDKIHVLGENFKIFKIEGKDNIIQLVNKVDCEDNIKENGVKKNNIINESQQFNNEVENNNVESNEERKRDNSQSQQFN
ncbi:MAG: DUF4804 domain-containing protein, partial [Rickettsiales bacterium]|nr:DUF4804 domain-containing protein [Rickettsiales bacterium]